MLDGTAFDTEARLALLTLHERSRDWRAAIEVAQKLEQRGAGSFAPRISHYWCEIALEAAAKQQAQDAQSALQNARAASTQAARPLVLVIQNAARQGDAATVLSACGILMAAHPAAFNLVVGEYAQAALASGAAATATQHLHELQANQPTMALLDAQALLDPEPTHHRARLLALLRTHPSLSAAKALISDHSRMNFNTVEVAALTDAIGRAALPLHRYRCAACGFEAQRYFWQCPGCLNWDSYPPQRLEDL
jgi:lipopolysaccharide assembly protein B